MRLSRGLGPIRVRSTVSSINRKLKKSIEFFVGKISRSCATIVSNSLSSSGGNSRKNQIDYIRIIASTIAIIQHSNHLNGVNSLRIFPSLYSFAFSSLYSLANTRYTLRTPYS